MLLDTGQRPHELQLSLAVQRADPEDLALLQLEAHLVKMAGIPEVFHFENAIVLCFLLLGREDRLQLAADHHLNDLILCRITQTDCIDQPPVLHDGDGIPERKDLLHAVRDK